MSKFNFDLEFFRRVISKCEKTEKLTSLSRMAREAVDVFYDEYDYYPDLAVWAPGTFMIMGDHLEYVKGNLVQAALPLGAIVVGKSICSVKCKLATTSKEVEGPKKTVFSIPQYKKNLKVYPEWMNYIKGVVSFFPRQDVNGFCAVTHSNVPFCQGYGSSAAFQVGFYTFLEAVLGDKTCQKKREKGSFCHLSETQLQLGGKKLGLWNNFASAMAEPNTAVRINCRTNEVSKFDVRDINILFLLTYPNFEIERKDRDLVCRRKMELYLAGKLLGLEEIIDASEYHLSVLENMEDPTKDTVREIMKGFGASEECLEEFIEDLFYFPEPLEEFLEYDEGLFSQPDLLPEDDDFYGETTKTRSSIAPCMPYLKPVKYAPEPKPPSIDYIQRRIAELCAGKPDHAENLVQRVCEEINCLGGLENLSTDSGLTICGKLLRRLRHIITENMRSLSLSDILSTLDYEELGTKLIQSHLSLKLDYDVSCPTLDGLVQLAIDADRVYGAKMTSGGGTLTLLHRSVVEKFVKEVIEKFGDRFQFYLVFPSSGAKILNLGARKNPKSTLSDVFLNRDELQKSAIECFEATYKYRPTHGAFSPGVVNLIGDHTDYNHGLCISVAINMMTVIVGALNGTSKIRAATTADLKGDKQKVIFSVPDFESVLPGNVHWAKLVRGVVSHFKGSIKGFDCLIHSCVPRQSGFASKTALVMALYTFLEEICEEKKKISASGKAHRCMLAIQEFTNVLCGIGDNLVAAKSKEDFVVFVDSWTVSSTLIPFQDQSVTLLLTVVELESQTNRALLYIRMEECYEVAKALGRKTLRCLTLKDLDGLKFAKKKVPESSVRRAMHIITENERVLRSAEALKNNDFEALGELMVESHNSLRDNYEVTHPELDSLVATAMEVDGVLGSKMPNSGYTTCTITLVKRWATDDLIEYMQNSTSRKLLFYVVNTSECCNALKVREFVQKLPSPEFIFEDIFPF